MTPAVGQVWQDNDTRVVKACMYKRLVRIVSIDGDRAACEAWYDEPRPTVRRVRIRLDRFRPNSTGYRYLRTEDVAS